MSGRSPETGNAEYLDRAFAVASKDALVSGIKHRYGDITIQPDTSFALQNPADQLEESAVLDTVEVLLAGPEHVAAANREAIAAFIATVAETWGMIEPPQRGVKS